MMKHPPIPVGFNPSKSPIQFDPVTIITIAALGAAGFGISEMMSASGNQPSQPALPALPNQSKADMAGKDQMNARRKLLLASGGQTDYTSGSGVLNSADTTKTTLLGN